jgi:hypothetical protein
MNIEICNSKITIKWLKENITDNHSTRGLILEVSVAINFSSESKNKTIFLNKVIGCTQTIIKKDSLPDQLIESRKGPNYISCHPRV